MGFISIGQILLWIFVVLLNYSILANFGLKVLKILQLNEYNIKRTFKHFFSTYFLRALLISAFSFALIYFFTKAMQKNSYSTDYSYILLSMYMFMIFFCSIDSEANFPKFTKRLCRIIATTTVLLVGGFSLGCIFLHSKPEWLYSLPTLIPITGYFLIYFATLVLLPLEMTVKATYVCKTKQRILERKDMLVIGVTGSFGKTSTKNFLDMLLSEKFVVLSTPKNYNTPMGVTRTVLNNMTINQEIFIVEMGAYKRGDIAELCRLVHPQMGLLTSIGGQHLNTFKTLENIYKTKNELIESLPYDGTAFFNLDNELCRKAFEECKTDKIGVSTKLEDASLNNKDLKQSVLVAENIEVTETGMNFSVRLNHQLVELSLKVLGKHNITNLLLSIAVANKLGLTEEQIRRGVAKIRAVPHRLELKRLISGDLLIDDAYNSNVVGFKNALEVLKGYNRRKVVVTPGIIDLGKDSEVINAEIGCQIAKVADEVIIVKDTNKKALLRGLTDCEFDKSHMYYAKSFKEAQKKYGDFLDGNSVILLENDLPENYT